MLVRMIVSNILYLFKALKLIKSNSTSPGLPYRWTGELRSSPSENLMNFVLWLKLPSYCICLSGLIRSLVSCRILCNHTKVLKNNCCTVYFSFLWIFCLIKKSGHLTPMEFIGPFQVLISRHNAPPPHNLEEKQTWICDTFWSTLPANHQNLGVYGLPKANREILRVTVFFIPSDLITLLCMHSQLLFVIYFLLESMSKKTDCIKSRYLNDI